MRRPVHHLAAVGDPVSDSSISAAAPASDSLLPAYADVR
jgi:hypothetical protein